MKPPIRLDALTTFELREVLAEGPCVALLPVGSVEPHGPHLPLATDGVISEEAATRAAIELRKRGLRTFVAPTIPYGVTEYAREFKGALSVPAAALVPFVRATAEALLRNGFRHVSIVNNHLEPEQDRAIRTAAEGDRRISVSCPLTRRWAKTLSDEFRSGACHAGEYETSLVLAATPSERSAVRAHAHLPIVSASLSDGIKRGLDSFEAIGMPDAYTGAPSRAAQTEGDLLYEKLVAMIVTEVEEALAPT